jgi:hypothetical protein
LPEAAAAFDVDPTQLVQLLKSGDGRVSTLLVGVDVYPQLRPLELALIDTRKKVAAGAGFLVTHPIFDAAPFEEWMTAVRNEGLNERAGILAAVQPLTNVDEAVASQRRRHIPDEVSPGSRAPLTPLPRASRCAPSLQRGSCTSKAYAVSTSALQASRKPSPRSCDAPACGPHEQEGRLPERYHVPTVPTPGRFPKIGKYGIVDWREDCARCRNCVKNACVSGIWPLERAHDLDPAAPLEPAFDCRAACHVQG